MFLEGFKLVTVVACEGLERARSDGDTIFILYLFLDTVFFAPLAICVIFMYTYSAFFGAGGAWVPPGKGISAPPTRD